MLKKSNNRFQGGKTQNAAECYTFNNAYAPLPVKKVKSKGDPDAWKKVRLNLMYAIYR